LCDHLVIGITNPDPRLTLSEKADPARSNPEANILTYYERYLCIRDALLEGGYKESTYSILPFPISFPELYGNYLPLDAVFFISIYDDWGRAKKKRFEELGLALHILREVEPGEKGLSSTGIRKLMAEDGVWESFVPPSVAARLRAWGVPGRILSYR
jgi:nicotinamide-nucleotide adenylyltransferase